MLLIPATCCSTPLPYRSYTIAELRRATERVAALTTQHPSWPLSRVKAHVARELNVSTVQLRYMLRKASEQN